MILRPRRLATRILMAVTGVALVALLAGTWVVQRVTSVHRDEDVRLLPADPEGAGGMSGQLIEHRVVREVATAVPRSAEGVDTRLLLAIGGVFGGAILVTGLVAARILGPVRSLQAAASRLADGRLDTRVPVTSTDELGALATAFNRMADRLETTERLKQDLTSDVAHELRTPLTHLRCHLEAMQDGLSPLTPEAVATLHAEVSHLQRLVDDLATIARAEGGGLELRREAVPVDAAIGRLQRELAPRLAAAGLVFGFDVVWPSPCVDADPARFLQVLRNLCDNAIAHTPPGGRVAIAARTEAGGVVIDVSDSGAGIEADQLPHIFERFYRTDPSRSRETGGTGLGLAIVQQLAGAHGATVEVQSVPGAGSTFTVRWPAFDEGGRPAQNRPA